MDLDSLLSQLQSTQAAKSAVRLSERNVVELIVKLKQLGIFGEELLHTINGKEYITTDRLKADVQAALDQAGGRLELAELPALVGVDLAHCDKQASAIVAASGGSILEAQGELLSLAYFDALAAEVNDLVQEAGVLSLADLATSYRLSAELLLTILAPRTGAGRAVDGQMEGGLLYTPAHVRSIKARLRGALRGTAAPLSVAALAKAARLQGGQGGGGGGSTLLAQLVEELAAEGAVAGRLQPGGGAWVPAAHAAAQQGAVRGFYQQNGWVGYDTVKRAGLGGEPKAFLRGTFPEGIALEAAYVSPALVAQLEAGVEEALGGGGWLDAAPLLPPAFGGEDVAVLLALCPGLAKAAAGGGRGKGDAAQQQAQAEALATTCVVSAPCLALLRDKAEAAARAAAQEAMASRQASVAAPPSVAAPTTPAAPAPAGKKGGGGKAGGADPDDDDWSMGGGKKGGKKGGKAGGGGGKAKAGGKAGGANGGGGGASSGGKAAAGGGKGSDAVMARLLSPAALADLVVEAFPDMEGAGEGGALPDALAERVRAPALAAYQAALAAALNAGAEERRRLKDALARGLDDAFTRLQLYGRGAELLEDEATAMTLQRHAARTAGAEALDCLLRWARLEYCEQGADLEAGDKALAAAAGGGASGDGASAAFAAAAALAPAERARIARALPDEVGPPLVKLLDLVNSAGCGEVDAALEAAAGEAGLRLRRLDKKAEKAALGAQRARLEAALAPEAAPAACLALAVPLLFLKATGRLVSVPGRAIGGVLQQLASGLDEEGAGLAQAFHESVVEALRLQAGAAPGGEGGEEEDGAARAARLDEQLAEQLPRLKAMAGVGA